VKQTTIYIPASYKSTPKFTLRIWRKFRDDWNNGFRSWHRTGGQDAYAKHIAETLKKCSYQFFVNEKGEFFPGRYKMLPRNLYNFAGKIGDFSPKKGTSDAVIRYVHCYLIASLDDFPGTPPADCISGPPIKPEIPVKPTKGTDNAPLLPKVMNS